MKEAKGKNALAKSEKLVLLVYSARKVRATGGKPCYICAAATRLTAVSSTN